MSVNRLMCSIHQTLYTSSTKQESALYARTIVPLRVAEKASYKLLQKKIALSSTPVESSIEWSRTHMCSGEWGGDSSTYVKLQYGLIFSQCRITTA